MTETPGKFVGTERRGNLDVLLIETQGDPNLRDLRALSQVRVWDGLHSPGVTMCLEADRWFCGLRVPQESKGSQVVPQSFYDTVWQWNDFLCTLESAQKLKGQLLNLQGLFNRIMGKMQQSPACSVNKYETGWITKWNPR